MPVRSTTDPTTGLPGYRWGRRGATYTYGSGTGRTEQEAKALAARQGRAIRLRQIQTEDWARGIKLDARRPGLFHGRQPRFSDRATSNYELMLNSEIDLVQRVFLRLAGPAIAQVEREAARGDRRQDAESLFQILAVVRALRATFGRTPATDTAEGLRFIGGELDEDVTESTDRELSRLLTIPLATAAGAEGLVERWVADNVSLITSLRGKALDEIEDMVLSAATGGTPTLRLRDMIEERFNVSRSKASLLARDQTAKLAGRIAEERHTAYGIERFQWSTSGDSRVRQSHAELDGQIFTYADGAPGQSGRILPGEEFQCRCVGIAVLDDADAAMLREQALARQRAESVILQQSPTVQGEIPNYSGFSDWNRKRIAALREGDPRAVGLPAQVSTPQPAALPARSATASLSPIEPAPRAVEPAVPRPAITPAPAPAPAPASWAKGTSGEYVLQGSQWAGSTLTRSGKSWILTTPTGQTKNLGRRATFTSAEEALLKGELDP